MSILINAAEIDCPVNRDQENVPPPPIVRCAFRLNLIKEVFRDVDCSCSEYICAGPLVVSSHGVKFHLIATFKFSPFAIDADRPRAKIKFNCIESITKDKPVPLPEQVTCMLGRSFYKMSYNYLHSTYSSLHLTLPEIKNHCSSGDGILGLFFFIDTSFFDTYDSSNSLPLPHSVPQMGFSSHATEPQDAKAMLKDCLAGIRHPDVDIIVIFGNQEEEEKDKDGYKRSGGYQNEFKPLSKYYVNKSALSNAFPVLTRLFVKPINNPETKFIISPDGNCLFVPFVEPDLAKVFLTYVYTRELIQPPLAKNFVEAAFVFANLFEIEAKPIVKHWMASTVDKLLDDTEKEPCLLSICSTLSSVIEISDCERLNQASSMAGTSDSEKFFFPLHDFDDHIVFLNECFQMSIPSAQFLPMCEECLPTTRF